MCAGFGGRLESFIFFLYDHDGYLKSYNLRTQDPVGYVIFALQINRTNTNIFRDIQKEEKCVEVKM